MSSLRGSCCAGEGSMAAHLKGYMYHIKVHCFHLDDWEDVERAQIGLSGVGRELPSM
jgi:hypothetical protein